MEKIPIAMPDIDENDIKAVSSCLRSRQIAAGKITEEFEKLLAKEIGVKCCLAVNSGTTALRIALRSLKLSKGSEVIIPDMSFAATAHAVSLEGLIPIFCDIKPDGNIDESLIEKRITPKTKAVLVVHLHGICAKIDMISEICRKNGLFLVEDCAQAFGSNINENMAGSFGDVSAFSLYATKNIATGEGGVVCFNHAEDEGKALRWVNNGRENGEEILSLGDNLRLSNINASLGISQLKKHKKMLNKRKVIAEIYNSEFSRLNSIILPPYSGKYGNAYHHYNLIFKRGVDFNEALEFFGSEGISIKRYYPYTLSECAPFRRKPLKTSGFISKNSFCIPIFSSMKESDAKRVAKAVKDFVRRREK